MATASPLCQARGANSMETIVANTLSQDGGSHLVAPYSIDDTNGPTSGQLLQF